MLHKIKRFLYFISHGTLFKRYYDKWFRDQLQEPIVATLKELPQGMLQEVFEAGCKNCPKEGTRCWE